MSAREDLLAAAGALAERASEAALSGKPITYESIRIAQLVEGSRAALEAAGLVDADPAPIIAAAERLAAKLEQLGAETEIAIAAQVGGAAEAIDTVTAVVDQMLGEMRLGVGAVRAYQVLHELVERLEVDFGAAETETASRIAARLTAAREQAEELITKARRGEG